VTEIPAAVEAELARLRADNTRLLRLLKMTSKQAAPPGPAQAAFFDANPGMVDDESSPDAKVAFFGALSLHVPMCMRSGMTMRAPAGAAGSPRSAAAGARA
jgi:hypothetical protein